MNKLLLKLSMLCFLVLHTSCAVEEIQNSDQDSIIGIWELVAWNVEGGFDFNNDGVANTNLLNEIDCATKETLTFTNEGVVSLNTTFNPDIDIAVSDEVLSTFSFNITCDTEGVISLATSYTLNETLLMIGESEAQFSNKQITLVFEDRIKIYDQTFTEVIETIDLTLVYNKN